MSRARRRALIYIFAGALVLFAARSLPAAEPEARLTACLACHGANGTSETPLVPSLGGQPVLFLTIQLVMFREKLRAIEPMTQMLARLADGELNAMAAALAKLPPPPPPEGAVDAGRIARARALVEEHRCNFCHSGNYDGGENVPRLAGQREDYLAKTLADYKSNTRRGYDASMADVLYPISDEQLRDLAYFLARQR